MGGWLIRRAGVNVWEFYAGPPAQAEENEPTKGGRTQRDETGWTADPAKAIHFMSCADAAAAARARKLGRCRVVSANNPEGPAIF